jgi:hypothetical protein
MKEDLKEDMDEFNENMKFKPLCPLTYLILILKADELKQKGITSDDLIKLFNDDKK